jgi:hypothetical protein
VDKHAFEASYIILSLTCLDLGLVIYVIWKEETKLRPFHDSSLCMMLSFFQLFVNFVFNIKQTTSWQLAHFLLVESLGVLHLVLFPHLPLISDLSK